MIRVAIVDDEILARVGIQSLLESCEDIQVAGSFGVAEEAFKFLRTNLVDIVITDIEMPNMNGLELIRRIREQKLAAGVIILSCYEKFEYAKEAISLGVDGYILKQDINQEAIEKVVYDVAARTRGRERPVKSESIEQMMDSSEGVKTVAVMKIGQEEGEAGEQGLNREKMMLHLLEELVAHYHMGNVLSSYKRNPFIIFRFEGEGTARERHGMLEEYIDIIEKNFFQYTNRQILFGISGEFMDTREILPRYEEAEEALQQRFYHEQRQVFFSGEISWQERTPPLMFSEDIFLNEFKAEILERELSEFLRSCREQQVRVKSVREGMNQSVSILMFNILKKTLHRDGEIGAWMNRYPVSGMISDAACAGDMKRDVLALLMDFHRDLEAHLREDSFGEVFRYIDRKIQTRLSLEELAALSNMSVSAFSKRFKERTSMPPIQYINLKKIEKVKEYLKRPEYTLGEIADLTGFSNENYMVRVFKKITGSTITDYRKQINMARM